MRTLLVTGASGFVGGNLVVVARDSWAAVGTRFSRKPELANAAWVDMDLRDESSVHHAFDAVAPDAVIHLGAVSNIDLCEREPEFASAVNVAGTEYVANAANQHNARLISISTDNVFDSTRGDYSEHDPVNPINTYGRTKVAAEEAALVRATDALIVRIPLVLGFPVTGHGSHFGGLMGALRGKRALWFVTREVRTPIDVVTLSHALLELAAMDVRGILHVAGTEAVDRGVMGRAFLRRIGLPEDTAEYRDSQGEGGIRPEDISLNVGCATGLLKTALPDFGTVMERAFAHALPETTRL